MWLLLCVSAVVFSLGVTSWTQQYSDASSTSYVSFKGTIDQGWRYLGPRASSDAASPHSPCVTEDGIIYLPLQSRVLAVSPHGYVLREYDVQQKEAEYYLQAGNIVFSQKYGSVIVLASGTTSDSDGYELVRLSAMDPISDKILWYNDENEYEARNWLVLSEKYGLLYIVKGSVHGNSILALSVTTGSVVWSLGPFFTSEDYIFMKVSDDFDLLLVPSVPGVDDGILYAINAASGKQLWQQTLGFNYDASFVISSTGVIYGCIGLFPDIAHGKQIVILDAMKGTILYTGEGYCSNASQALAPSVDSSGNGYYSCGNQVFSVTQDGKLRWQSAVYGYQSLPPHIPVSIHPDGTLFYVTINQTTILALSSRDGSFIKSYTVSSDITINQPPILVGDKYMYIVGMAPHSTAVIYPMKR